MASYNLELKGVDEKIVFSLSGRIDSGNAAEAEKEMLSLVEANPGKNVVIDMTGLEYVSSAGLRGLLKISKQAPKLILTEVSPEVYEIFEMTGFLNVLEVKKRMREVSVEGCPVIGEGKNSIVYRLDEDKIIKVYKPKNTMEDIENEHNSAQKALLMGMPTAVSYDIVRVGNLYGTIFELVNARSVIGCIYDEPENKQKYIKMFAEFLKEINAIEAKPGELPSRKERYELALSRIQAEISEEEYASLKTLMDSVPESNNIVHGDYQPNNVMVSENELLIIDMDTLSVGDPIFDLVSCYNTCVGFEILNPGEDFLKLGPDNNEKLVEDIIDIYYKDLSPVEMEKKRNAIYALSLMYMTEWAIRHPSGVKEGQTEVCKSLLKNAISKLG